MKIGNENEIKNMVKELKIFNPLNKNNNNFSLLGL